MSRNKTDLRREQEIEDLKKVMSCPEGRRFIWRLLGQMGIFRPSFVAGSPDTTAFNDGARYQGLNLLGEIMAETPKQFLTMQQEAMNDEQRRREEDSSDADRGDSHD